MKSSGSSGPFLRIVKLRTIPCLFCAESLWRTGCNTHYKAHLGKDDDDDDDSGDVGLMILFMSSFQSTFTGSLAANPPSSTGRWPWPTGRRRRIRILGIPAATTGVCTAIAAASSVTRSG